MTKAKPLPSQEELHALFEYKDGKLFWKVKRGGGVKPGDEAEYINNRGYKVVRINKAPYLQHRLIWVMHGNEPVDFLDHIDGDKLNNRIENLRPATVSENKWNTKVPITNTSGIKGVCWNKNQMRWNGHVRFKGKQHHVGSFENKEECAKAVKEFREKLHGDFANHG